MAAKMTPDLLLDQLGRLGTKDHTRASLMGLELIEGVLDLPTLTIRQRELSRGKDLRIEDRGDQRVALGAVWSGELIVHDPNREPCPDPFGARIVIDLGEKGPIGEDLEGIESLGNPHPPQQVRAGARRG